VVWLVGITNLVNLMDGVDGLAAGISFMLMILLVYVGHQNGTFALLAAGMSGALLGFLKFNFPPARIYLGDGGAYFIGFQVAMFSLAGSQKGAILAALIAPLFVLAFPIADTAITVLRRGLRGLPVFRPDRGHIHHRLLDLGLSHVQTVLLIYGLCVALAILSLVLSGSGQLYAFLGALVVFGLVLLLLERSADKGEETAEARAGEPEAPAGSWPEGQ